MPEGAEQFVCPLFANFRIQCMDAFFGKVESGKDKRGKRGLVLCGTQIFPKVRVQEA